jgi:predicted O-linked N-acetylglucosamine transferase (SPINDLY family)
MPHAEHLARHALADLALDTLRFNGHTTTVDALWAGLPVLTCPGASFPARVAASLLSAAGLPELIASGIESYEAAALTLATNPARLKALRDRLAGARTGSALFDTAGYARRIERALDLVFERFMRGEAPADTTIA